MILLNLALILLNLALILLNLALILLNLALILLNLALILLKVLILIYMRFFLFFSDSDSDDGISSATKDVWDEIWQNSTAGNHFDEFLFPNFLRAL